MTISHYVRTKVGLYQSFVLTFQAIDAIDELSYTKVTVITSCEHKHSVIQFILYS